MQSLPSSGSRGTALGGWGLLGAFVGIAYALSWAWTFPFAAVGDVIEKGKGWPTNLPAAFGPAVAAFIVTAWLCGRRGVDDLAARSIRWRTPARWWIAALAPLWFLAVALVIAAVAGNVPKFSDFGLYSGLPSIGVAAVVILAILSGLGEVNRPGSDGGSFYWIPTPAGSASWAA